MLILIGPSASGKTEVAKLLMKNYHLEKLITCTTREKRLNEIDGKDYYLVIMWYGKTTTSGIDEALAKHFYHNIRAYLIDKGITQTQLDSISFRVTNGDKVANVAEDVAKDGDIDLLFGCGNTIGGALEDANVTIYERTNGISELGNEVGFVINGKEKRNHCLLSENQVAKDLYDYVCTAEGHKMRDISYEYSAK